MTHGAYVCLDEPAEIPDLGLRNEFEPGDGDDTDALLRRVDATAADIDDDPLLRAKAIVHVAAGEPRVDEFCAAFLNARILKGALPPMRYTGGAMYEFAYKHRVLQHPGGEMPNAFLVPLRKTPEWWAKDWMERHTYFLPRYEHGKMVAEGHALAAREGVPAMLRRTYASEGDYAFGTNFASAGAGVPPFRAVCAALGEVARNPGWAFVREGPTWQGRRVGTVEELCA